MNARPTRQQPFQSFLASPVGVAQGVALITVVVLLLIGILANRAYADHLRNQLREQVAADLQRDEIGIRAAMARYHATLLALQAHVLAEDQEDFDDFQRFVSPLFKAQRGIDSLRLLPDQGRPIVYPPSEGETTLLIDSLPESQANIRQAMEIGQAVLSPVYVRPDENGTLGLTLRLNVRELNGQYWGQVVLDFDAAVILDESGLTSADRNLRIGLHDSRGMALLGESDLLKADPIQVSVELPGVSWTLLGMPLEGWDAALALALRPVQGVGLLAIVLGGIVAYQVALRQRRLKLAVGERTAEIARINTQLREDIQRRERAEAALQATESRFRGAFTHASMGMALTDLDGAFFQVNEPLVALLEYSPAEFQTMKLWEIAHAGDRDVCQMMWQSVLDGQRSRAQFEMYASSKSGNTLWAKIGLSLVRDEAGRPLYFIFQFDDRTQHKQMEEALWQQILRNELILQTASDGFCMVNDAGTIIEVNPAFGAMTGYRQEELLDRDMRQIEAGNTAASLDVLLAETALRQAVRFETQWRCKDGRLIHVSGSMSLVDMDRSRFFFITAQDVTERRKAEQALRDSQLMLQTLMSNLPGMAYRCQNDPGWMMEFISEGCVDLIGYDPEDLLYNNTIAYNDVIHPDDREGVRNAVQAALAEGRPFQMTYRVVTRGGMVRWVWEQGREVQLADGRRVLEGLITDISKRVLAEEALRKERDLLSRISQTSPVGIAILDREGCLLFANPRLEEILARPHIGIVGPLFDDPAWKIQGPHGEPLPAESQPFTVLQAGWQPIYDARRLYVRPNGEHLIVSVNGAPLFDEFGQFDGGVFTFEDVSERERAAASVRETQAQLRQIIDLVPHLIFVKDRAGRFLLANRAIAETYGVDVADLDGRLESEVEANRELGARYRQDDLEVIEQGRRVIRPAEPLTDAQGREHVLHTIKIPFVSAGLAEPAVLGVCVDITEQVRAEEALRLSEKRYRSLFEDVPIALWEEDFSSIKRSMDELRAAGVTDFGAYFDQHPEALLEMAGQLVVVDVNQASLALFEAANKEALIQDIKRTLREESYTSWREEILCFAGGSPEFDMETAVSTVSGAIRDVAVRVSIAPGHEQTWDKVLVSMNDVTRQKQAERAEREQRTLAEALRDSAATLVSTLDWDTVPARILETVGRVVAHDSANICLIQGQRVCFAHARGYGEATNEALRGVTMPLDVPSYRAMIETGQPCLIRDTALDPEWIVLEQTHWVRSYASTPLRVHGQVIGFLNLDSREPNFFDEHDLERLQAFADQAAIAIENAQLYDQIRRHAAELADRVAERTEELENERARLQAILDSMGEGVVYSEDFAIRYINWRVIDMLGYSKDEIQTLLPGLFDEGSVLQSAPPFQSFATMLYELNENRLWRGEFRVRRRDGSAMDLNLIVSLVSLPGVRPVRAVTLLRDVSQERALQAQKDRFIANASHELRTPITNMKMRLYLLPRQPEKFDEHMQVLRLVTDRMETLVRELLDVSRFERGVIVLHREPVVLQELLDSAIRMQRASFEQHGVALAQEVPTQPVVVSADRSRLTQVITNLLTNAMNYTPAGGSVRVVLEHRDRAALIHVHDTGIGIDPAMVEHIFEPFFRVNESDTPGSGLGLTISREIVNLHGGEITVRSELNAGSVFTVRLPAVDY